MFPIIILDLPHQWSFWQNEILLDANEVIITAYPDLANLRDAKSILDILREMRGVNSQTRLILNKVGLAKEFELSAKDFEASIKTFPTTKIPFEAMVHMSAMNSGQSLLENNGRSKSAKLIRALATEVSGRVSNLQKKERSFRDLKNFFQKSKVSDKRENSKLPLNIFKSLK